MDASLDVGGKWGSHARKGGHRPDFPVQYPLRQVHMKKGFSFHPRLFDRRAVCASEFGEICEIGSGKIRPASRRQSSGASPGKAPHCGRVSFDVGIHQLGGFSVSLSQAEISLGKRESVRDVAKNLERMVQGVMVRTFSHNIIEEMAGAAGIPVINGLTDFSHPCQAMADYMTILESKKSLKGIKIAYIGDGNNVAHSLIYGAVRLGAHLAVGTPEGYEPNPEVLKWARENARHNRMQAGYSA